MKEFEIIDHTADIGIVAYGKTKREVFINEIIAGENRDLKENFYAKIKLEAKSLEDLLIAWLNELLYISEVKLVILNKFIIKELSNGQIKAEVGGTKINHLSIRIKREVKAVTYHRLEIKKDEESGLWSAQVIFDI
jgi:SHS2 domain-containing protein